MYVLSAFKHQAEGIDCNLIQRLYLLLVLRAFIAEPETQCTICIHIYFTLIESKPSICTLHNKCKTNISTTTTAVATAS